MKWTRSRCLAQRHPMHGTRAQGKARLFDATGIDTPLMIITATGTGQQHCGRSLPR